MGWFTLPPTSAARWPAAGGPPADGPRRPSAPPGGAPPRLRRVAAAVEATCRRSTRPGHDPQGRVVRRHDPPPLRAGRAPGEARRTDPAPRINLVLYHGVLAPHARWRGRVVAHAGAEAGASAQADAAAPDRVEGSPDPAPEAGIGARREPADAAERPGPNGDSQPRRWTWANLMRRAFDLDVLACPRCGGRMSLIATIDDPRVIRNILSHLGLPTEVPQPRPFRPPPAPRDLFQDLPACRPPT